jgi:hypothetical protein
MSIVVYSPPLDRHRVGARWLAVWLVQELEQRGLVSRLATESGRSALQAELGEVGEGLAAFCHGSRDGLHDGQERVLDGENMELLAERWLYACACAEDDRLLNVAIHRGLRAAVGYRGQIDVAGVPAELPEGARPLFRRLLVEAVLALREGVASEEELRRRVRRVEFELMLWNADHVEALGGVEAASQTPGLPLELIGRLAKPVLRCREEAGAPFRGGASAGRESPRG